MIVVSFLLCFLRFSLSIGLIRALRGLIGFSGVMILSTACCLFFQSGQKNVLLSENLSSYFWNNLILEVLFGVWTSMLLSLLLEIIPMSGRLIDTLRGSQMSEQLAPELGIRDSQLEMFGGILVVAIFLNGQYFLSTLQWIDEYRDLVCKVYLHGKDGVFYRILVHLISGLMEVSTQLVVPLVLICLTMELAFSVLQKLNSRIQLGPDLNLLKSSLGIFFLFALLLNYDQPVFIISSFYRSFLKEILGGLGLLNL